MVAGHRRLAAAAQAGHESVPCLIREDLDAAGQVVAMLVENIHRQDITAAEEVRGLAQLARLGPARRRDRQPRRPPRARPGAPRAV